MRPASTMGFFALIVGILMLIQGIWNLIHPPFLEIFTSNVLHAVIHVLLGIAGIWTGLKGGAKIYLIFLGILLLTVGALYFVPGAREPLEDIFNVNLAVAWLNIGIGILSLMVVVISRPQPKTV